MVEKSLAEDFYCRETVSVARELLGQVLVRVLPDGLSLFGQIVETEAYLGLEDPACHSFGGRLSPRTQTLYLRGGYSYVYFIYGMYHCFNVVTGDENTPEAVLIRAVQPLEGLEAMWRVRSKAQKDRDLCSGPGKLCQTVRRVSWA